MRAPHGISEALKRTKLKGLTGVIDVERLRIDGD